MKVDVEPMLAATTSAIEADGKKATQLLAFLGASDHVKLSWKPKTQAAEELEPVVMCSQVQHVDVSEALISQEVRVNYEIRRRGVDAFTLQLPRDFRVTSVEGANISKWDLTGAPDQAATAPATAPASAPAVQQLNVKLFAAVKDNYALVIRMERFLKDPQATLALAPVVTHQALQTTGLLAVTHSSRRSVELSDLHNLARVEVAAAPDYLRNGPGLTVYRFLSADYGAQLAIGSVAPRISAQELWTLGVDNDRLELRGLINVNVERAGVFELALNMPDGWEITSVGPKDVVEDFQTPTAKASVLTVLLKRETLGVVRLDLQARRARKAPDEPVELALPLPAAANLQLCSGQLVLLLPPQLGAEVDHLDQLQSLPVERAAGMIPIGALQPSQAFEFQAMDRTRPAGVKFRITVKPSQVSAIVHRQVRIGAAQVAQEALVRFIVRNAPVDTFYIKMPASLADEVTILGKDIKEQPRLTALPPEAMNSQSASAPAAAPATAPVEAGNWTYFKIVLQSPVMNEYDLTLRTVRAFGAGTPGKPAIVTVEPIVAAGKIVEQSGDIAIVKDDTLAIAQPESTNLISADPGSEIDLPYAPYRAGAILAFKYTAVPYELKLPVTVQQEAEVFTRIVTGAVIEQVIDSAGMLNAHATYLMTSSRGDRLAFTLPAGAELYGVLLNGNEVAFENGQTPEEKVVRMPPSAGQETKVTLEISYRVNNAKASDLAAPQLPASVPVTQTLWRLWAPDQKLLLGYDHVFTPVNDAGSLLAQMGRGYSCPPQFKLPAQGQAMDFLRLGPPGRLNLTLVGSHAFSIGVWAIVLTLGGVLLRSRAYGRVVVVLAAVVAAAALNMVLPLLLARASNVALWPMLLVLALWLGQWLFIRRPRSKAAMVPPLPATAAANEGKKE